MRSLLTVLCLCAGVTIAPWRVPPETSPSNESIAIHPGLGLEALVRGWKSPVLSLCKQRVILAAALPDSTHRPDYQGEWVEIRNMTNRPIDLTHYILVAGRRKVALDGVKVGASSSVRIGAAGVTSLGSLRLRNRNGCLELLNPCDKPISTLEWHRAREGVPVIQPTQPQNKNPQPTEVDEGFGGCGQT